MGQFCVGEVTPPIGSKVQHFLLLFFSFLCPPEGTEQLALCYFSLPFF